MFYEKFKKQKDKDKGSPQKETWCTKSNIKEIKYFLVKNYQRKSVKRQQQSHAQENDSTLKLYWKTAI